MQFVREVGGPDITVTDEQGNDVPTNMLSWSPVGDFEVATLEIAEMAHSVVSEGKFGIMQYGWTVKPEVLHPAGYAYPAAAGDAGAAPR